MSKQKRNTEGIPSILSDLVSGVADLADEVIDRTSEAGHDSRKAISRGIAPSKRGRKRDRRGLRRARSDDNTVGARDLDRLERKLGELSAEMERLLESLPPHGRSEPVAAARGAG